MHVVLAALFYFAILTLWMPAYWPVTVFQAGVFVLAVLSTWKKPPRFSYPLFPLLFAVLWGLLQWGMRQTAYVVDTQGAIVRWATFLAVFLVGFRLFQDARMRSWFRAAMLVFASIVALLATVQTFTAGDKVFWLFPTPYAGIMGPILSHNHFAAFVEVVLPIAVYEAIRRERGGLLYAGMAAVLYASVIASTSRAGLVLATAEILVTAALMWRRGYARGNIGTSFAKIAVLFFAFTLIVGWDRVWGRLISPDPMFVRREFAVSTLQMIAAHPWMGIGMGAWPTVYPQFAIIDIGLFANQAHSDWLQWTAEGGIIFGVVMASLFFWCLRPAVRSIWGLGAIAVLLHACVDYPFSRPALGAWPVLIIAMLAGWEANGRGRGGQAGREGLTLEDRASQ